ncbi:MAG: TatD family hydrolase [Parcubacteria group bacterium]
MKTSPRVIDTHCHLDDHAFDKDRQAVYERAKTAGVVALINPGSNLEDSQIAVKLAHEYSNVYAAVGLHPHFTVSASEQALVRAESELLRLTADPLVVAVGEFGLDVKDGALQMQLSAARRLLTLAQRQKLPVILHCRQAYRELFSLIEEVGKPLEGIMHAFAAGPTELDQALKLGLHVAFGGMVTFEKRTELLREAVKACPLERMLLETDAPYLTPEPRRGQRNEPAEVATIGQFIASLRGISYSELAEATTKNARRLFGLPDEKETHNHQNSQ